MRCAVMLLVAVGLWGQAAPYDVIISGARVVDGSGSPVVFRRYRDSRRHHRRGRRAGQRARRRAHRRAGAWWWRPASSTFTRTGGAASRPFPPRKTICAKASPPSSKVPTAVRRCRSRRSSTAFGRWPISVNFATFVGQGSIRQAVIGLVNRKATPSGDRQDEGAGRAGHARRRLRTFHRTVLRARQFHAHRGSDRTREGGGQDGRHPHFAHARGSVARAGQRARDHSHRRRGRAADADHAPQDHRAAQLGQERGDAEAGGRGARARRGCDHRSVSVHRVEHRHRRAGSAVGARRRAEIDLRAAGRAGPARADQSGHRAEPEGGPRRRRSEERGHRQLRVRSHAGRQEPDRDHAGARRGADHGERRRDRDGPGEQGRLLGGLSRHRRRGRGAHHALSVHHDRVRRRHPRVRPGGAAPAQLRHVRARARRLRAREERAHAGGCGAPHVRHSPRSGSRSGTAGCCAPA